MKQMALVILSLYVFSSTSAGVILIDPSKSYPPTDNVDTGRLSRALSSSLLVAPVPFAPSND